MTTTLPQPTDTRPRITYRLPNGELVKVIHDHGQIPTPTIGFTLVGGEVVEATLVPRKVRVRFASGARDRSASAGWSYFVTCDSTGREIGSGWSAGKKSDAMDSFKLTAHERGWVLA